LPQKCKGFFSFFGALHEIWLFCPVNLRKFSAFASLTFPKLFLLPAISAGKEKNIAFGAEKPKYVLHFAQKAAIVKL
jgi:hypothetical protein